MNKIFKYMFSIILFSLFFSIEVNAATTFTMAECSENNYIRKAPGSDTKLTDVDNAKILLSTGHKVEILETVKYNGQDWYKIFTNYYSSNYTGYIYSGYFKNKKSYTIDDNYMNQLKTKGFPESYLLPLAKLHAQYSNWNFEVSMYGNGLEWDSVINGEYTPVYKNLIQDSSDKSLWSTDPSVYSNGNYTVFEQHWHAPTKQTIGFYVDPRNWFNEKTIFMFEQLSYNSTLHTVSAVQSILNGTFMEGSYNHNGQSISYAQTFVDAALKWQTSPIQLASRVVQEQGKNGSATINMDGGDGKIYYNFFNVNVSGDNLVQKALATAKANGWDNPYTSIVDGSKLIANGYSAVGQDTLYYQKFNTINDKYGLYKNQYMANVRVLPSESISLYSTYKTSGVLNSAFTFKIPVYLNMPNSTTLSINENSENNLNSLVVTNCNLNPTFYAGATSYSCSVKEDVTSVNVTADASSQYASVKGTGTYQLTNDTTTINIVVTAANGETKTYTVTVSKVKSGTETASDVVSHLGYNNKDNVLSNIPVGENIINISASVSSEFKLATVSFKDIKGVSKTNGVVATGDVMVVTINGQKVEFTLRVKGDVSSDGVIDISDLAMVKAHMLSKRTLDGVKYSASDINGDGTIDISDLAMIKAHMLGKRTIVK